MRRILALVSLAACGSPTEPPACSTEEIRSALAAAHAGDTIRICAGEFFGEFSVPPGVSLVGAGTRPLEVPAEPCPAPPCGEPWTDATRLVGSPGSVTITLHASPGVTTRLTDVNVAGGRAAVGAQEPGAIALERVWIEVATGFGVFAENVTSVTLSEVTARGAMTPANAGDWVEPLDETNAPVSGVELRTAGDVEMESVDVQGFTLAGVVSTDTTLYWSGGRTCGNKNGLLIHGGATTLYDVDVCDLLQGFSLSPSIGFAIADGANVQTTRVRVTGGEGSQGVGFYQEGSTSQHQNLVVSDNGGVGVQLVGCRGTTDVPAFSLTGADSQISRNTGAGVLVTESTGVVLDGARIEDTRPQVRIMGDLSNVEFADGIEIIQCLCLGGDPCAEPLSNVRLANLGIAGNGRAGIVVDAVGGSAAGVEVEAIHVASEGDAYGAIQQRSTAPPAGWDTEIDRSGAAVANDAAFVEPIFSWSGCGG